MKITRRDVLKAAVTTYLSGITLAEIPTAYGDEVSKHWVSKKKGGFDPIHMYIHDISNDYGRQDILGQALLILHTNFRHKDVMRNGYYPPHLTGPSAEYVTDKAWKASNLAARGWERKHLLWFQLEVLRLPDSAKEEDDEGVAFPAIHIKPFHAKNDVWGQAFTDKVVCKFVKEGQFRRTGEFEVEVNTYHLGARGDGSDKFMWASVIAHEMLHNLGHMHRPGEYVDGRQINAFHRAVYCGGKYTGKNAVPAFG